MKTNLFVFGFLVLVAILASGSRAASVNGDDSITSFATSLQKSPILKVGAGEPAVSITIIPTSGLNVSSPNYATNKQTIMLGLTGAVVSLDPSLSSFAWNKIDYFPWGDMVLSAFNSYRGVANPSGVGSNELGNRIKWCVIIKSTNGVPFSINQVWFAVNSSYLPSNLSGNIATNTSNGGEVPYQFILQGRFYGPDRIKGTADDAWYNDDANPVSSYALVDEVYYFGVSTSITVSGEAAPALASARSLITAPGFTNRITYYLKVGSNTNGFASAVLGNAPRLVSNRLGTNVLVQLVGQPGINYTIQTSTNLQPITWATLGTSFVSGARFTNNPASPRNKFFRAFAP